MMRRWAGVADTPVMRRWGFKCFEGAVVRRPNKRDAPEHREHREPQLENRNAPNGHASTPLGMMVSEQCESNHHFTNR